METMETIIREVITMNTMTREVKTMTSKQEDYDHGHHVKRGHDHGHHHTESINLNTMPRDANSMDTIARVNDWTQ
jgi:ABC-type nickel/cobalt efflux system permease component RcnA